MVFNHQEQPNISSNLYPPSLHAFLCYLVGAVGVSELTGPYKKGVLHHVCGIFLLFSSETCGRNGVTPISDLFRELESLEHLHVPLLYIILSTTVSFCDLKNTILFLQCLLFNVYIFLFLQVQVAYVLCAQRHLMYYFDGIRSQFRLI